MTEEISDAAEIRPIGPDDLADVRSLHAVSFRVLAGFQFTDEEITAFTTHVYSVGYTAVLSEAMQRRQVFGAWMAGELVGTAGWTSGDGSAASARIRWVFVRPMFNGLGLGTRLLGTAEAGARRAGFDTLSVEATLNAAEFFARRGYKISSHGVRALDATEGLPVAFMRKQIELERSQRKRLAD